MLIKFASLQMFCVYMKKRQPSFIKSFASYTYFWWNKSSSLLESRFKIKYLFEFVRKVLTETEGFSIFFFWRVINIDFPTVRSRKCVVIVFRIKIDDIAIACLVVWLKQSQLCSVKIKIYYNTQNLIISALFYKMWVFNVFPKHCHARFYSTRKIIKNKKDL